MRRFIALALLGGLLTLAGHAVVSLGLHPAQLAAVPVLLQGSAALVLGAALFVTGMLGLADGYEQVTGRVQALLEVKDAGLAESIPVHDLQSLQAGNRLFWQGYTRANGSVALFLGGLLALAFALSRHSAELFTVGVGAGVVALAVAALVLAVRGLGRLRRAHVGADLSARSLEQLPDRRPADEGRGQVRRPPRYALFPRTGRLSTGRNLDQARQRPPAHPLGSRR